VILEAVDALLARIAELEARIKFEQSVVRARNSEREKLLVRVEELEAERNEALNVRAGMVSPIQRVVQLKAEVACLREALDSLRAACLPLDNMNPGATIRAAEETAE
jgi:hypothetical protein